MATLLTRPAGVHAIPWSQYYEATHLYTLMRWDAAGDRYLPTDHLPDIDQCPDLATVVLASGPKRRPSRSASRWITPDRTTTCDELDAEYVAWCISQNCAVA